jgi:hypothetical protein
MATLEELYEGIRRAGAANDAKAVRVLGIELLRMEAQSTGESRFPSTVIVPPFYRSSYQGKVSALHYALRESLPESVFLGVLLGIGIYIFLWIPRLTLRAVRIVKAKPSAP